ncbi:MAG: adenylate/guanylate cyclase domain-containing protein [Chloroflexi bacterium]|nr:adenylate/guanylate cyclase domain-containing protein [Chloroflexota bacterium]
MTTPSDRPPVAGMGLFPDQNPNPVLRMDAAGVLTYANAASKPILQAWQAAVGETLPEPIVASLRSAAGELPPGRVEVVSGRQTFDVLAIHVPEIDAFNLYGTDITAAKVVERFPDRNPNPVLRMTADGTLWYANDASRSIIRALGIAVGDPLPAPLAEQFRAALADPTARPPEVGGEGGLTFRLKPVEIPEFEFINLYGTDITAEKAIDKFPNQNPNPVLRLTRQGRMTYANPASAIVRKALGAEVGANLAPEMFARILGASLHPTDPTMEVEADATLYRLRVVAVYEFDSINLYGTDITAARQVERLNADNEALLLNILPRSIAERLRGGETAIADRFDDMTVLFADVVGFTAMSSRLSASEVIDLLNEVFTACDRLAERFRLEKIKTVGDAYMVVGGLQTVYGYAPDAHATHAEDVAEMGLAIIDEVDRLGRARGLSLEIRVGMHVGPAVAGVIGLKKFIYDVWGDTVNMASRMESTGVPGRVQVSRETYDRLAGTFEFEPRGLVEVKGKGRIETWFVKGRRPRS